jgi:hypothetical protein
MSFRLFGAIALLSNLSFIPAGIAAPNSNLSCPIHKSVYHAIGKTDYKLIFSNPLSQLAGVSQASATLEHSKRGKIAIFVLTQSNGYGRFALSEQRSQDDESYTTVFFDAALKEVKNVSKSPLYLQISGLGSGDWYSDRKGNRDYPLGDVMWKLSNCQK